MGGVDLLLQTAGVTKQDTPTSSATGYIVGVLITVVLLVLIAKRHNWARWVFVVLTGLTVLAYVPVFLKELVSDFLGAISTAIQAVLHTVAVVLLLQHPVGQWFKNRNQHCDDSQERIGRI
jgi:hypothetical protein